ncbi:hypothetical protein T492DRAFT_1072462 [Pavlovales sp. CCMP2436]|nr:hypothetical protein T492DRAFT_1072462 [Pavlovales sp. CCMP2436]|mmetsp:Transcript_12357/g.31225  ORF Transcript_12357/g.31225 Transcript_12357/m.31225 type:complete len:162 (+) Transcript_12357:43-528(+)
MAGDDPHASDFVRTLLRHACAAQCNPSSLRQRLIQASDHHEANWSDMNSAKRFCVQGCLLAEGWLAREQPGALIQQQSVLPNEAMHRVLIPALDVAMLRAKAIDLLHRARDRVQNEDCPAECRRSGVLREPARFQGYDQKKCEYDCAHGCDFYVNALKQIF